MTSDKILMMKSSYYQACTVAGKKKSQNIQTKKPHIEPPSPIPPQMYLFQEEHNVKYLPFTYASVGLWFNIPWYVKGEIELQQIFVCMLSKS